LGCRRGTEYAGLFVHVELAVGLAPGALPGSTIPRGSGRGWRPEESHGPDLSDVEDFLSRIKTMNPAIEIQRRTVR